MARQKGLERALLDDARRVNGRSVSERVGQQVFESIGRVDVVAAIRVDEVLRLDVERRRLFRRLRI